MPKKKETFLNNYNNLIKSTESIQTANGFLLTTHLFLWWQWQSSPIPCHGQTSSQPKQHSCHRCQPRRVSARHRRWVSSGPPSTIPGSVLWNAGLRPLVGLRARLWTLLRCRKCMACLQSNSNVSETSDGVFFIPTPSTLQFKETASRIASEHIFNMSCILASNVFGLACVYFFTMLPWTGRDGEKMVRKVY